ncbi:MAG: glycine zipper domain-containing protein [Desulfovibrionaceae bacterium]
MRPCFLSRKKQVLAGLALLCFVATGCTSKYGPQMTQVNYYPQCYQPISELRQDENSAGTSTAVGAGVGVLLGALIGGLATGKAEGAVVGAVAGGATGAVAGNVYGKNQQAKTDQQKVNSYLQQLDGESANMDRATAAAKVATKCYDRQFQQAAAEFKNGSMTRQDFTNRYTEIRSGLEETSRILQHTASKMAEKDAQYQQVLTAEQQSHEQYQGTPESPVVSKSPKKRPRKPAQTAQNAPTPAATPVAQQTQKWSHSREALEGTKQDVDERMRGYDSTVDVLLGA